MLFRNPSIFRLFLAQALFWTCSMIGIALTALIGLQLAPSNGLATLPLTLLVLGNLLAVQPLSQRMQLHGRRHGFVLGALAGVLGGLLSGTGVWQGSFLLLCLGALPLGIYQASAMFYRFAAIEAVGEHEKGRATACVIGGGVCAALLAPGLSGLARDALAVPIVGAYLLMAAVAAAGLLVVATLPPERSVPMATTALRISVRSLLTRPVVRTAIITTAVGHGLMILVMNAAPLAMSFCGLSLDDSATVIQWHLLGMFLPAFVAGPLVDRFGSTRVALAGATILGVSAIIAMTGETLRFFLMSSCLLGIGWNLMLVAGTTLLGSGHRPQERAAAQGLMELANGSTAAVMSFACGPLISGLGWAPVNAGMLLVILVSVGVLLVGRRRIAAAAA
ncbi:MFS transporter [Stutzerimonas stutzeri]|uniref:MFS transporter n=1 Tax=Stutzerimonas sp. S1 TaxID=3030652 RepID=UPI00222427D0|nr:MFS transporter [Stutzerimonas sp. S1]MCW3148055.1 MFS transporter [Stutzerimonas sp. S1]